MFRKPALLTTLVIMALMIGCSPSTSVNSLEEDAFQIERIESDVDWSLHLVSDSSPGKIQGDKFTKRVQRMVKDAAKELKQIGKQLHKFGQKNPDATDAETQKVFDQILDENRHVYLHVFESLLVLANDYPELANADYAAGMQIIDNAIIGITPDWAGKETECEQKCWATFSTDQNDLDRRMWQLALDCVGVGGGSFLVGIAAAVSRYQSVAGGLLMTAICGWQEWFRIQFDAIRILDNLNNCVVACQLEARNQ